MRNNVDEHIKNQSAAGCKLKLMDVNRFSIKHFKLVMHVKVWLFDDITDLPLTFRVHWVMSACSP